eukprot:TRINITY_DN3983_c0_g1_i1.p1 TRINITY_DN3983_c0_g1~~TRINITY_DN3983_c0_g1_i1.p1  ORF type:complete len:302 (-),score=49.76 TRINITY_DN3983_c0_g1_i1:98-1003(-)
MKILGTVEGFSKDELANNKKLIYSNCVSEMKVIVEYISDIDDISFDENNIENAKLIRNTVGTGEDWNINIAEAIQNLWKDSGVQKAYERKDKEFQLNDSAQYFFERVEEIKKDNYVPNVQDMLRLRVRSTGITEAQFKFEGMEFMLLDVGGQRNERKKWIHCFESVTSILFCVSLNEYDQVLREDPTQNRMKESLVLFDDIVNSPWFKDTPVILFLNKSDLFKTKIETVNLNVCFENYKGGKSFEETSSFIKERFLQLKTIPIDSQPIFIHITCAINTDNIQKVFFAVKKILLDDAIKQII